MQGLVQVSEAEDVDRGREDAVEGGLEDQAEGEEGAESGEAHAKQVSRCRLKDKVAGSTFAFQLRTDILVCV